MNCILDVIESVLSLQSVNMTFWLLRSCTLKYLRIIFAPHLKGFSKTKVNREKNVKVAKC